MPQLTRSELQLNFVNTPLMQQINSRYHRLGNTLKRPVATIYLVLTECRLILPETPVPQPDNNVHDGAHSWGRTIMVPPKAGVQAVSTA